MKLYPWSCITKCVSILLNIPEEKIIEEIGHNGSEILWPDLHEPACRKGFHVQEIVHFLHSHQYWVMQIDSMMCFQSNAIAVPYSVNFNHMPEYLSRYSGILIGRRQYARHNHAVVWANKIIIDPDDSNISLDAFNIQSALFINFIEIGSSNKLLKTGF